DDGYYTESAPPPLSQVDLRLRYARHARGARCAANGQAREYRTGGCERLVTCDKRRMLGCLEGPLNMPLLHANRRRSTSFRYLVPRYMRWPQPQSKPRTSAI